jgi:hypothetical protein
MRCITGIFLFCILCCSISKGQNISHVEYFFNTDPGTGNGTAITGFSPDDTLTIMASISTIGLNVGFHTLGVRVKDTNNRWSLLGRHGFVILQAPVSTPLISAAEYFFDLDPGPGNGVPLNIPMSDDTLQWMVSVPQSLEEGFHILCIRTKDQNGIWSLFERRSFYVQPAPVSTLLISAAEYFFDTDPGPGNGLPLSVPMADDTLQWMAPVPQSLAEGFHVLSIRVKDQNGKWSLFERRSFYVQPASLSMPLISAAEYFIGPDPGVGNGIPIPVGSPDDTLSLPYAIPVPDAALLDTYFYTFRVMDITGRWSHFHYDTIVVAIKAPGDTSVMASPGICTKIVNGLDAEVINNEPYQYVMTGATTGSGSGSVSGFLFNGGVTTITYSLENTPSAAVTFTVTVIDDQIPTISCPPDITVGTDAGVCSAVYNYSVDIMDNCPGAGLLLLSGLPSGSSFPAGSTVNTWRVTDASGNSATCSFTVTVIDNVAPLLSCPPNITANTDVGVCTATGVFLGNPVASDNCSTPSVMNNGPATFPSGNTTVLWTATDANNNSATCTQNVLVVDNQNPLITCPANITVDADMGTCTKSVTYAASASDNCGIASIQHIPSSGSLFSVGTTIITATATDVNGKTSTCTFTVTVADDQVPTISCPANITIGTDGANCSSSYTYAVNFMDNCPGAVLQLLSGIPSGGTFPNGTTENVFQVTDVSGNAATCSFAVTVMDDDPPFLTCPPHITVNTDPGECLATGVSLGSHTASDNCGAPVVTNNAPSTYPIGNNTVTWTATDANNNSATCVQMITVLDNQAPVMTCPPDVTIWAGPGPTTVVNYALPVMTDNCPSPTMMQTTGLPSGAAFPVGTTINTFVATDASGLTSSCSFAVTVRKGRVGINTTFPLAMLHVADSSVVFTGPYPLPSDPAPPPVEGAGTRMMWYADKAAFRAGAVNGDQWNKESIGPYSIAGGFNTKASGIGSLAFGYETVAGDSAAIALGLQTEALGKYAVAMGSGTQASGYASMAVGLNSASSGIAAFSAGFGSNALGDQSLAIGYETKAIGKYSSAFNHQTKSAGDASSAFGTSIQAKAYSSMSLGRYNDTVAINSQAWIVTDPVFVVGAGSANNLRSNVLTVLKNGNTGLHTKQPSFRFHHVSTDAGSAGVAQGMMLENTVTEGIGEAGLSWTTKLLPANRKWITGLNQEPGWSAVYSTAFSPGGYKFRIDTLGQVTIGRLLPNSRLHVIRSDSSGGPFHGSSLGAFESNLTSYLQFSNSTNATTSILSGNQETFHRSGIVFAADSTLLFSAGGDSIRMKVTKNGNVGIDTILPAARLDVNGSFQLGNNGSTLGQVSKTTLTLDIPLMVNNLTTIYQVTLPDVPGDAVTMFVSPSIGSPVFPDGLIISWCHTFSDGLGRITFLNKSGGDIDPPPMEFYIAIIH